MGSQRVGHDSMHAGSLDIQFLKIWICGYWSKPEAKKVHLQRRRSQIVSNKGRTKGAKASLRPQKAKPEALKNKLKEIPHTLLSLL